MYNPALPNHFRDVVFTAHVRRRQREEAEAIEHQRRPNALATALSSVESPAFADVPLASSLSLSAEELHRHRVKESAALGIQAAVEMEKEALEVEHKKKKMEGMDARSRIGSRLDKLKALADKSRRLTTAAAGDVSAPTTTAETAVAEDGPAQGGTSSAPLVFQRSSLAAGGYVMTAAAAPLTSSSGTAARRAVRGKPSSTLLLRYRRDSPLATWSEETVAAAASASVETSHPQCQAVAETVQQLCRRFGAVRAVRARVFTSAAVATALPAVASSNAAVLRCEQLRVWVRFDSVTEAFKAAESLAREPTAAAEPVFSVVFFPTSLFDDGALQIRGEDETAST